MNKRLIVLGLVVALGGCKILGVVPQFREDGTPLAPEEIDGFILSSCPELNEDCPTKFSKSCQFTLSPREVDLFGPCLYAYTLDTHGRTSERPTQYCIDDFIKGIKGNPQGGV